MSNNQIAIVAKQLGGVLQPDNDSHTNRIKIKSESSNRVYVVAMSKATGEWQCSCPGWCMKKPGKPRTCKHLQAMQPALQQAVAQKRLGK